MTTPPQPQSPAARLAAVLRVLDPDGRWFHHTFPDGKVVVTNRAGKAAYFYADSKDSLARVVAMLSFEQRVKFNTHMEIEVWNRDSDGVVIDREWWPRSPFDTITAPASTWLDALCAATLTSASGPAGADGEGKDA